MAKNHLPDDNDQRVFGFVSEHERVQRGKRGRVRAHWRRLPGPQMAPRVETRQDDGPRVATPVITLAVTVNVSVAL